MNISEKRNQLDRTTSKKLNKLRFFKKKFYNRWYILFSKDVDVDVDVCNIGLVFVILF